MNDNNTTSKVLGRVIRTNIAPDIWNEASTETIDSYEENIDFYKENSYSYIPLPWSNQYYDVEEEQVREISDQQYIREDEPLPSILEILSEQPFVLYDEVAQPWNDDKSLADLDRSDYLESIEHMDGYVYEEDERWKIITWADFKKREAKEMFYPLIAEFSERLAYNIESRFSDSEEIVELDQLKPSTLGRWYYDRKTGSELHIAEYLDMTEMKQVVTADSDLTEKCGFNSKTDARNKIKQVEKLRNKVMHANRTLVNSEDDLENLVDTIRMIDQLLLHMEKDQSH